MGLFFLLGFLKVLSAAYYKTFIHLPQMFSTILNGILFEFSS